jgi:hypothetical protein
MELTKLTPRLSTSPQIRADKVQKIAAVGFRSILFSNWLLKDTILPPVYWHGMLNGREWLLKPHMICG